MSASKTQERGGDAGRRTAAFASLPAPAVTLVLAAWLAVFGNGAFWRAAVAGAGGWSRDSAPFLASLFLLVTLLINLALTMVAWPRAGKILLAALLLIVSVVAYFQTSFGIVIDEEMMRNAVETDFREAVELVTARMFAYVIVIAAIPIALLSGVTIRYGVWWKELLLKATTVVVTIGIAALLMLGFGRNYAGFLRNNRELRRVLSPTNVIAAAWAYGRDPEPRAVQPIGLDARRARSWPQSDRHALLVIVIGETARTANFSLGGYARETNPELDQRNVVFFSDMHSCGTSTASSLPCLFSDLGRERFSSGRASGREGLLDVVLRAGFDVLWRDNNSGCKGACERVETEDLSHLSNREVCPDGECWDEVLLSGLQERLDATTSDLVVVLHQKGSHGPAYYRRYPDRFEVFTPACRSADLARCTDREIVNAYDNTIRYTDHVLARTIDLLEHNADRFDSSMIFLSDHGESLGENGLYLHGYPYAIAPPEQTEVPMIVWLSPGWQRRFGLDVECLARISTSRVTHDAFFHSVLGLLDIRTKEYRPELDVFRSCRRRPETLLAGLSEWDVRSAPKG